MVVTIRGYILLRNLINVIIFSANLRFIEVPPVYNDNINPFSQ